MSFTLARVIAPESPDAIRALRRLLNDPVYADMTELLLSELRERNILVQGINHQEAVAARLAKRVLPTQLKIGQDVQEIPVLIGGRLDEAEITFVCIGIGIDPLRWTCPTFYRESPAKVVGGLPKSR